MHSVHLNEQVYTKAQRLAAARGFKSVDAFIADVVEEESVAETENFDHLFTPEVLAAIDRGTADADAGRVHTIEEVEVRFAKKRDAWLRENAS